MPKKGSLTTPSQRIFVYDNTFEGFLCCVFKSVYNKELPIDICSQLNAQPSLFSQIFIDTDPIKAGRVLSSIPKKIGDSALELLQLVFLSCMQDKEIAMLKFLLLGYENGKKTMSMLGHPDVAPLLKAQQHLLGECHLLTGFVRFSDYDGALAATITPKNYVLPLLAKHFVSRFPNEDFMIFDKTNKAALIYEKGKKSIVELDDIRLPAVSNTELQYRNLWKQFYKTIAIESRTNHKCRMTHMPKRYWQNMTEMQEFL